VDTGCCWEQEVGLLVAVDSSCDGSNCSLASFIVISRHMVIMVQPSYCLHPLAAADDAAHC